jgi:hypothetical protein
MARATTTIQSTIINAVQADPNLYDPTNTDPTKQGLTSTSQVAKWKLWTFVVAQAQNLFEQLVDLFKAEVEATVFSAAPGTPQWVQKQVLYFQYNASIPQVIQLNTTTLAPEYPIVNPAYRIITQCSVTTNLNKTALVKVAKAGPSALSTPERNALTSFLDKICFAGVKFKVISVAADFIMLTYDIYYDGQYSASIAQSTYDAINGFLATSNSTNFDGTISLSKLEDIIQAVPGVRDVVAKQVEVRPASVVAANAYKMVNANQVLLRNYNPFAGYMIVDTDAGRTLADTLNFIVSPN